MEQVVIAAYRALPGKHAEMIAIIKSHWRILNKEGLVSSRTPIVLKASDETVVEIFGWKSKEAVDAAHSNSTVQKLWENFSEVCEYVALNSLEESQNPFATFQAIA